MNEQEMREAQVPTFDSYDELAEYVKSLVENPEQDYGTCVYAMSMSAYAAYSLVAHKLGVTGFQASVADLDFLGKTRGLKAGRVLDYKDLLYPQNRDKFDTISQASWKWLQETAEAEMVTAKIEGANVSPVVWKHWQSIVDGEVPFGLKVSDR